MVTQHVNMFRNLETVVRELDDRGHETVVLHGTRRDDGGGNANRVTEKPKMVFMGRGIDVAESRISNLTAGNRPDPDPSLPRRLMRLGRQVVNVSIYLRRSHPAPERVVSGLERSLPPVVRRCLHSRIARSVLRRPRTLQAWRRIETIIPSNKRVTSLLAGVRPDVVLVSPTVCLQDAVFFE